MTSGRPSPLPPNDEARNIKAWRTLWGGVVWVVMAMLATFGVAYATEGTRAAVVPGAYEVMIRYVPGGLHTYGTILLVFAALMLHGLIPAAQHRPMDDAWLRRLLPIVLGISILIIWCFAWSWYLSGDETWQGMAYWAGMAALTVLARWKMPPPAAVMGGDGRDT